MELAKRSGDYNVRRMFAVKLKEFQSIEGIFRI
jgi:hypothetical protein